jgi:hypothetical protein
MSNKPSDQPVIYQRLESGFVFVASLYLYLHLHFHLLWFIVFLLSIDVFMVGYLINNNLGATIYNLGHTYIIPAILLIIGVSSSSRLVIALGIIWTAHIAMDRALGFGLKFPTGFKDTHLGHIK